MAAADPDLPFLGVLVYLIARGHDMNERAASDAQAQDSAFRQYVRSAAASPADDVAKFEDLRNRGVLSEEEFQRASKSDLLAQSARRAPRPPRSRDRVSVRRE